MKTKGLYFGYYMKVDFVITHINHLISKITNGNSDNDEVKKLDLSTEKMPHESNQYCHPKRAFK